MGQIIEYFAEADPLAIYGALTGTVALVFGAIAAFNNFFDRPWLRVRASVHRDRRDKQKRSIVTTLLNVGRRKASCYPPTVKVADMRLRRFLSLEPDQLWADGHGWYENEDKHSGYPDGPIVLPEYGSEVYLFDIASNYEPLWVVVSDTLQRRKRKVFGAGRLKYAIYGVYFWLRPFRPTKKKSMAVY